MATREEESGRSIATEGDSEGPRCEWGFARTVWDEAGVEWRVRLMRSTYAGRRVETLVFETEDTMRRVRNFPADWADLPDCELYALSLSW